jgi:type VI secretion system protein ImpF
MADLTLSEKLQPSLLDRLTDDHPDERVESRDQRVIDMRRLREIVQRDLTWLLNTANNEDWIEPDLHPHVARSVVNYGIETVSGEFSTVRRAELIRQSIARAIETFEPRIRRGSTRVEMRTDNVHRKAMITYDIRSEMWAEPIPIELYLRSSVDVTTGEVTLERTG